MRLKLIEKGWDSYEGDIGGITFVNGESIDHVSRADADRIACVMRTEIIDGEYTPINEAIVDRNIAAPVKEPLRTVTQEEHDDEAALRRGKARPVPAVLYTREELEAIADEKGIAGLREIAEPIGVRDRSISGLIKETLQKQTDLIAAWEKATGRTYTPEPALETGPELPPPPGSPEPEPKPTPAPTGATPDSEPAPAGATSEPEPKE